jgi:hypothetical protein
VGRSTRRSVSAMTCVTAKKPASKTPAAKGGTTR